MKMKILRSAQTAFFIAAVSILSSVFTTKAFAQRTRVAPERQAQTHMLRLPPNHTRIVMGGHPYFFHNGYFYRGWRGRYVMFHPPIGARLPILPYGFWSFRVGPAMYYYGGGAYFQYIPNENVYVVVPKPNQAPASPSGDEDIMYLTDGTSLSGVFAGATADSIQFQVNNEIRSVPITQVKSVSFAPSTFKEQK
ncbi:MAG: DUF6515 family protein [Desulfomonilaceae bacterium]